VREPDVRTGAADAGRSPRRRIRAARVVRQRRRSLEPSLRAHRIDQLTWHVRFDHHALAALLSEAGLPRETQVTHVLSLEQPYEATFAAYSATRRNQIRKCLRRGVRLRQARSRDDVNRYASVHERLETAKDFTTRYPADLLHNLVQLEEALLILAEVDGRLIAGALFFIDGKSMLYWHGASDREAAAFFPMPALMDEGIQRAYRAGLAHFNFGGSPSESWAGFKESFGAIARSSWSFTVVPSQPMTQRIAHAAKRRLRTFISGTPAVSLRDNLRCHGDAVGDQ
jgi:lipid II:glycine glycyltransferase (peptidoglycan interpeptide bridge formation enzyme)